MGRPLDVRQARAAQPDLRQRPEPRCRRLPGRAADAAGPPDPGRAARRPARRADDRVGQRAARARRASIYLPTRRRRGGPRLGTPPVRLQPARPRRRAHPRLRRGRRHVRPHPGPVDRRPRRPDVGGAAADGAQGRALLGAGAPAHRRPVRRRTAGGGIEERPPARQTDGGQRRHRSDGAGGGLESFVSVSRKGFLYRRTIGAFGLEIPVGTKAVLLATRSARSRSCGTSSSPCRSRRSGGRCSAGTSTSTAGAWPAWAATRRSIVATGDGDWRHPGAVAAPERRRDARATTTTGRRVRPGRGAAHGGRNRHRQGGHAALRPLRRLQRVRRRDRARRQSSSTVPRSASSGSRGRRGRPARSCGSGCLPTTAWTGCRCPVRSTTGTGPTAVVERLLRDLGVPP